MTYVLAFAGKRLSGKSLAASIVLELDSRFILKSFAEPAKQAYCKMLGLKRELYDTLKVKESHRADFIEFVEKEKKTDPAIWAKTLFQNVKEDDYIVIDDLRFIEELQMIMKFKGIVYKIMADPRVRAARGWKPDPAIDEHYSELEMDLSSDTFHKLTRGGGIYNNDASGEAKLRGQVYQILMDHFR